MTPIMVAVFTFVGAIVITELIAGEIVGWLPIISRAVVRASARRLPPELRDRYVEEWLHDVDTLAVDRKLSAFVWALGTVFAARSIHRDRRASASKLTRRRVTYRHLYWLMVSQGVGCVGLGFASGLIAVNGGALPFFVSWPLEDSNVFAYTASIMWSMEGAFLMVWTHRLHHRLRIPSDAWVKVEFQLSPPRLRIRLMPPARATAGPASPPGA